MDKLTLITIIYIVISSMITIWTANILYKNGKVFLRNAFNGDKELSISVNNMLRAGF